MRGIYKGKAGIGRVIVMTVAFLAMMRASCKGDDEIWRRPENGGINVLYCYLRVHNVYAPYETIVSAKHIKGPASSDSIVSLRDIAKGIGVPMEAVKLTIEELMLAPMPLVTHVDTKYPDAGTFILLLNVNKGKVDYLDGPTATIQSMSLDDFRRAWSGFALLPKRSLATSVPWILISGAIGCAALPWLSARSHMQKNCKRVSST